MKIIAQKYGGSSVATTEKIQTIAEKVKTRVNDGYKIIVVLSAMGKTTDKLIELADEISIKQSAREMDMLLATGEQVTISLFSMALHKIGVPAISLTGPQAGIVTDSLHGKAKIQSIDEDRINKEFETNDVVVIAGFQGINAENNIATLGRGGSDLSAVAIAAALKTECCEIYTDVDGIFTTDPRIVKNAKKLDEISFDEMLELASSGAGVMQARSIECGKKYGIPIRVRSTFGNGEGTLIKEEDEKMEKVIIRGIAIDKNEAKVTLKSVPDSPGMAAKVFSTIGKNNINVDMIIQNIASDGSTDISFTAPKADLDSIKETTKAISKDINANGVDINPSIAKISVVGIGMKSHAGVASKMFEVLAENKININMITTSEIKISVVVEDADGEKAVKALHAAFNLDK